MYTHCTMYCILSCVVHLYVLQLTVCINACICVGTSSCSKVSKTLSNRTIKEDRGTVSYLFIYFILFYFTLFYLIYLFYFVVIFVG